MISTNKHGQAIGRKGAESRRKILDATRALIVTEPAHRLSASGIARAAGFASQTFYLYFADIEEVLLELSTEAGQDMQDVVEALNDADRHTATIDRSRLFVDRFSVYWDRHRPILSVRNYLADNGHIAFLDARQKAAMPIIGAIADRILAAHLDGDLDRKSAFARAVIIYSAIERMAARPATLQHQPMLLQTEDLMRAETDILTLLFTPVSQPAQANPDAPRAGKSAESEASTGVS